jgi:hypothetical protein
MTISATTQGIKPGVCLSTSRPVNPFDGQVIYMTDVDQTAVWDGSQWTVLAPIAGGRNMVVNGAFSVWQRGTSFSSPANATFTADRWFMYYDGTGATRTISQQTFTGDNPTGLNVSNYMRVAFTVAGTGSTTNGIFSKTEDVRKLNGQTVTLSFYGKADASRNMNWQTYQEFGTGGSSAVLANSQGFTFTSSWQRFSVTFTMPSVSGKTITSNSSISFIVTFPPNATGTFDITGVQLEAGAVATPFEFEDFSTTLDKCQRYYEVGTNVWMSGYGVTSAILDTRINEYVSFNVTKRSAPTVTLSSITKTNEILSGGAIWADPTVKGSSNTITGFSLFSKIGTAAGTAHFETQIGSWSAAAEL